MNPFLTCSPLPHPLHRSALRSPHRQSHCRPIWAIYAVLKPSADEIGDVQFQTEARRNLAWALLYRGDLPRARSVAEEASRYRHPPGYPGLLAARGVVALRQGNGAAAREELTAAAA